MKYHVRKVNRSETEALATVPSGSREPWRSASQLTLTDQCTIEVRIAALTALCRLARTMFYSSVTRELRTWA